MLGSPLLQAVLLGRGGRAKLSHPGLGEEECGQDGSGSSFVGELAWAGGLSCGSKLWCAHPKVVWRRKGGAILASAPGLTLQALLTHSSN